MKGRWIKYTEEELAWIKARAGDVRRIAYSKFVETFGMR